VPGLNPLVRAGAGVGRITSRQWSAASESEGEGASGDRKAPKRSQFARGVNPGHTVT